MDFVAKPVQADVLVAKLKAMLDQWSARKPSKGVNGSLREMGLPDIVQVLFHGRKTGKLNIRAGGQAGEIHFLEGNIANAILGDVKGTSAFYAMLPPLAMSVCSLLGGTINDRLTKWRSLRLGRCCLAAFGIAVAQRVAANRCDARRCM